MQGSQCGACGAVSLAAGGFALAVKRRNFKSMAPTWCSSSSPRHLRLCKLSRPTLHSPPRRVLPPAPSAHLVHLQLVQAILLLLVVVALWRGGKTRTWHGATSRCGMWPGIILSLKVANALSTCFGCHHASGKTPLRGATGTHLGAQAGRASVPVGPQMLVRVVLSQEMIAVA